ncbi:MAG: dipeptide/oligopeptide/nickel ABC transporter ATP-binding protein [Sulfobacillus benefaciens]|uniref:Dipeptide/oligopeptide/nickel ABC transporter ATP-binding protein n=1 Tax=Sulfobacillus benefaciens TaxID=453960 RepID=A0A2T2X8G4_9FIRM|nr:MAG: dipeptide/oligopeptide/nickel ABC transporter ATP-binding protein [Sulfobacillus benefaciens]
MKAALSTEHLTVSYDTPQGLVAALRGVSFTLFQDEILGLVGESGSGKSTLALAISRLLDPRRTQVSGKVLIGSRSLYDLSSSNLRHLWWEDIAMVFQSSMNALNPVLSVKDHFADTFLAHRPTMTRTEIRKKTISLLQQVQLSPQVIHSYPHELSGGMKQRVVIALALALDPKVLIMDEPTTALDVVVQHSILAEVAAIQKERHLAVLFISHDFSMVSGLAHRIAVMYAGELVEITKSALATGHSTPHHPYTQGLIQATPQILGGRVRIQGIPGEPPDMSKLNPGCAFWERCSQRLDKCQTLPVPPQNTHTFIRCHLMDSSSSDFSSQSQESQGSSESNGSRGSRGSKEEIAHGR